jgi:hypothetical protein
MINREDLINKRVEELKANFYAILDKEKLIKKQGKVPFIEHLTSVSKKEVQIPEQL